MTYNVFGVTLNSTQSNPQKYSPLKEFSPAFPSPWKINPYRKNLHRTNCRTFPPSESCPGLANASWASQAMVYIIHFQLSHVLPEQTSQAQFCLGLHFTLTTLFTLIRTTQKDETMNYETFPKKTLKTIAPDALLRQRNISRSSWRNGFPDKT